MCGNRDLNSFVDRFDQGTGMSRPSSETFSSLTGLNDHNPQNLSRYEAEETDLFSSFRVEIINGKQLSRDA